MKWLWQRIGTMLFWLSWPAQWVYLRIGHRTRVLIIAEGQVLFIKGWIGEGKWGLPGGGVHYKEDRRVGAVREVREEIGVQLEPEQLHKLATVTVRHRGLKFACTSYYVELPKKPSIKHRRSEIIDSQWFPVEKAAQAFTTIEAHRAVQTWLKKQNLV